MDVKSIEALLRAAQVHVDLWKVERVESWNPTPETVEVEVVDQNREAFGA
jgi:hypothetical protein